MLLLAAAVMAAAVAAAEAPGAHARAPVGKKKPVLKSVDGQYEGSWREDKKFNSSWTVRGCGRGRAILLPARGREGEMRPRRDGGAAERTPRRPSGRRALQKSQEATIPPPGRARRRRSTR